MPAVLPAGRDNIDARGIDPAVSPVASPNVKVVLPITKYLPAVLLTVPCVLCSLAIIMQRFS